MTALEYAKDKIMMGAERFHFVVYIYCFIFMNKIKEKCSDFERNNENDGFP